MMTSGALALSLLTACHALSLDFVPQGADDSTKFGAIGSKTVKVEGSSFDMLKESWWGEEAAQAEAKAVAARDAAAKAEKAVGSDLSARQMEAMDRRAEAEARKVWGQESKLDSVVDSMRREGDAADRVVETMVRNERLETAEEERKFAEMDRKLRKAVKTGGFSEDERRASRAAEEAMRKADAQGEIEERDQERQARQAAKELREAAKQVDTLKNKEKAYQHHRGQLELETSMRIWKEADSLRLEADNATLPQEEVLRLLDVTKGELINMTSTLSKVYDRPNASAWFQERIQGIHFKSVAASAHLLEAVKHKTQELVSSHLDYDDKQFVAKLSRFLNDTKGDIGMLQETHAAISKRVLSWDEANPEKLTSTVALALNGVTGNAEFKSKLLQLDTYRLGHSNASEACGVLGTMLAANMRPAYRSLGHMKAHLDDMTKAVTSVTSKVPLDAGKMLANGTRALLNMAYAEHIALKEASTAMVTHVAPLVLERLHCSFNGAAHGAGLAFAVVALAVAALVL